MIAEDKVRRDLYWALRTRVLTPTEMDEVRQIDYWLAVEPNQSFKELDKKLEFMEAPWLQFKMHLAAERADGGSK